MFTMHTATGEGIHALLERTAGTPVDQEMLNHSIRYHLDSLILGLSVTADPEPVANVMMDYLDQEFREVLAARARPA
jgi:hypothetical protein